MTSVLPRSYFEKVVEISRKLGDTTAELECTRVEASILEQRVRDLEEENRQLRARVATAETEAELALGSEVANGAHDPREARN
jgi:regulator of replication initiation timing